MDFKKINLDNRKFSSPILKLNFPLQKSKYGIIYTIYSDTFNIIELGFAENNKILETKLSQKGSILLDKKRGKKQELKLLIETLNELGIEFHSQFKFQYSKALMRHLCTLGWPIGKSLYKKRIIQKKLSCA